VKKQKAKKRKHILLAILFFTFFFFLFAIAVSETGGLYEETENTVVPAKEEKILTEEELIQKEISVQCLMYKINCDFALQLALFESTLDADVKNLEGSSAKGIYQFIDSTWHIYCEGDVINYIDNISCFMKIWSAGDYHHWTADERTKRFIENYEAENGLVRTVRF